MKGSVGASTAARVDPAWADGGIRFRSSFLDFDRGIRVGNLEPNERITRILKSGLEARFAAPFVTERWGRGVYWQWIGYLARENRSAKPLSSDASFGCSKFFVSLDGDERRLKCGMQVERGYLRAPAGFRSCRLRADWDWHRLLAGLRPRHALMKQLARLVADGFEVHAGSWDEGRVFAGRLPSAQRLSAILANAPGNHWCGFQVYYPLGEADVRAIPGAELIDVMMTVFDEVAPAMSLCSQVPLASAAAER